MGMNIDQAVSGMLKGEEAQLKYLPRYEHDVTQDEIETVGQPSGTAKVTTLQKSKRRF